MTESSEAPSSLIDLLAYVFKPHPWHGVAAGKDAPRKVTAFIEIVPTDTVKYELDKASGYLRIDRPQQYSNICPTLYGFVPQTYCGDAVGEYCAQKVGRTGIIGDGDPLDICVLTEKVISHGDLLVAATPIGGLRMIDKGEADDKIIAVLEGDAVYGGLTEIERLPAGLLDRLKHYFLTYKKLPGSETKVEITHTYSREEAYEVIAASQVDYNRKFAAKKGALKLLGG